MTTDFRALCAELVELLDSEWFGVSYQPKALDRARAALASPPPELPTDEELYEYWISTSPQFGCADPVGFVRAALERWSK